MTLRRHLIRLLLGSLLVVTGANGGRYYAVEQERGRAALDMAVITLELHVQHTFRAINEAMLTELSNESVAEVMHGLKQTEQSLLRLDEIDHGGGAGNDPQWVAIREGITPFTVVNNPEFYNDSLHIRYGQLIVMVENYLASLRRAAKDTRRLSVESENQTTALLIVLTLVTFGWVIYIFMVLSARIRRPLEVMTRVLEQANGDTALTESEGLLERVAKLRAMSPGQTGQKVLEIDRLRRRLIAVLGNLSETLRMNRRYAQRLQKKSERMAFRASHDPLTLLPNRDHFDETLRGRLAEPEPGEVAVMFIDLDRFKSVNDTLGHDAGDRLLSITAERLQKCFRKSDLLARFGGDEFAAVITGYRGLQHLQEIAQRIVEAIQRPYQLGKQQTFVGSSIGISLFPEDGKDSISLIRSADSAMYAAKAAGKGCYRFYSADLNIKNSLRMMRETRLHNALADDALYLVYQPQVLLESDRPVALEALLRWRDVELGDVSPLEFIPIAEETGLINEIGIWVLQRACLQFKQWLDLGLALNTMAVNVSPLQFREPTFAGDVVRVLEQTSLAPHHLELEITENVLLGDEAVVLENIRQLSQQQIQIAIDDFGTGYASLRYLYRLPVDRLKIDRELLSAVPHDSNQNTLVRTIIGMAADLGIEVVAEGVETEVQRQFLAHEGCLLAQGFFYARPMAEQAATSWLFEQLQPAGVVTPLRR